MGVSTNAILFYGYCWDEEYVRNPWQDDAEDNAVDTENNDDDDDWEVRYARAKGCLPPEAPWPERVVTPTRENGWSSTPKDYTKAERAIIDQHRAYWEAKSKIVGASPCLVGRHCMASCPMAYVAVKVSEATSLRGHPSKISSLAVDSAWNTQLAEFCKLLGIRTKGKKAAWWLVSDWSE